MRPQWCREHIDETAEHCGLSDDTVTDVKRAAKFCSTVPEFSDCGTDAIMALIRIKDDPVRDKAISWAKNALNSETHVGKNKRIKLTRREIQKFIQKAELEVRGELTKKYEQEKKTAPKKPSYNGTPQPGDYPAPPAPVAQTLKEKYGGQDQFVDANEMIPAPVKESLTTPNPSNSMGLESAPWNCGVLPCPDGGDHIAVDKIRGKLCDLLGLPCNQLEKKRCPVLIRQQKARETGFYPASEPFPGAIVKDDLTGGTYVKPAPMKITKAPEVVSFTPSQKQYDFIQRVIKSGEFETAVEFLSELVDRAMEQEGS